MLIPLSGLLFPEISDLPSPSSISSNSRLPLTSLVRNAAQSLAIPFLLLYVSPNDLPHNLFILFFWYLCLSPLDCKIPEDRDSYPFLSIAIYPVPRPVSDT